MSTFDFELGADYAEVRGLRAQVRDALEPAGVHEDVVDQVVLVLDEIVSNAIEHGTSYRLDGHRLGVRVSIEDDLAVSIRFHDPGCPPQTVDDLRRMLEASRGGVAPDSERGRGLFLIDDGLDDLAVTVADEDGGGMNISGRVRSA